MKTTNTWIIRRLVDESFIPLTQRSKLKIVGFLESFWDWPPYKSADKKCQTKEKLSCLLYLWMVDYPIWQYPLWSFQGRDKKLGRFLAESQLSSNEITKFGKLQEWRAVKKCQNFLCQMYFFFHWRKFFDNINF